MTVSNILFLAAFFSMPFVFGFMRGLTSSMDNQASLYVSFVTTVTFSFLTFLMASDKLSLVASSPWCLLIFIGIAIMSMAIGIAIGGFLTKITGGKL